MSSRRTAAGARRLVTWLVAVPLAAPLLASASIVSAAPADPAGSADRRQHSAPFVALRGARNEFSPDGDGYHDGLGYRLVVRRKALVYVSIVDMTTGASVAGEPGAGTSNDGCLTIGRHRCVFPKGRYRLDVGHLLPSRFRYPDYGYAPGRFRLVVEALTVGGPDRYRRMGRTVDVTWGLLLGDRAPYTRSRTATLDLSAGATLRMPYRIESRSEVSATFLQTPTGSSQDYAPYASTPIGTLGRGRHVWRWDGTIDGRPAAPGPHYVSLGAERLGKKPWYHSTLTVVTVE